MFSRRSSLAVPASFLYELQKTNSWMSRDDFKQWSSQEFVPKVANHLEEKKLPRQALLLRNNAPSFLENEDLKSGNIKAVFLPAKITSLLQPMV